LQRESKAEAAAAKQQQQQREAAPNTQSALARPAWLCFGAAGAL